MLFLFLSCPWACWLSFLPHWPIGFITLLLGFPGPFTLLLSFIMSMGLLTVIPTTLAHWVYYLFSWASSAHLLYFYHLLFPWVCWLSFLSCWFIEIIILLLSLILLFPLIFLIVGFLLPLDLLSKVGIYNFFFNRKFQPMVSTLDDDSLSSNQDIN